MRDVAELRCSRVCQGRTYEAQQKRPGRIFMRSGRWKLNAGSDLLSRGSSIIGPEVLTAVFGMGTGVAPLVWPPAKACLGLSPGASRNKLPVISCQLSVKRRILSHPHFTGNWQLTTCNSFVFRMIRFEGCPRRIRRAVFLVLYDPPLRRGALVASYQFPVASEDRILSHLNLLATNNWQLTTYFFSSNGHR